MERAFKELVEKRTIAKRKKEQTCALQPALLKVS